LAVTETALDIPSFPLHAHFAQRAFQVLYVGFMNSFEAVPLDQLNDSAKTGLHIGRQTFEFISNLIVEQLYDPCHLTTLLHFCNVPKRFCAQ
jgi:hypothetical protein